MCMRKRNLVGGEEGFGCGELVGEDRGVGGDCGHGLTVGGKESRKSLCGGNLGLDVFAMRALVDRLIKDKSRRGEDKNIL